MTFRSNLRILILRFKVWPIIAELDALMNQSQVLVHISSTSLTGDEVFSEES